MLLKASYVVSFYHNRFFIFFQWPIKHGLEGRALVSHELLVAVEDLADLLALRVHNLEAEMSPATEILGLLSKSKFFRKSTACSLLFYIFKHLIWIFNSIV